MNKHGMLMAFALVLAFSTPGANAAPPPISEGSWTLALLPDTQIYTTNSALHEVFDAQTQFLADIRESHNLAFVLHEGDIVNNNTASQWSVASSAMCILDDAGVNYALALGNHDMGSNGSAADRGTLFDDYFPLSRLSAQPTFGGTFPGAGGREAGFGHNTYHTFSAGGDDWMALSLEFGPRDGVVDWADATLKAHPNHKAMLVTHAFVYSDDTRYDWATKGPAQNWNPHAYGVANQPGGVNDGEELWQKLKDNPNLHYVFNGHVLNDGTGLVTSLGDAGNVVHQVLSNYQFLANGGQGYLRLLEFLPDGQTVNVRTYSPWLDARGLNPHRTEPDQQFTLSLVPPPPPPPTLVLAIDRTTGQTSIVNHEAEPIDMDSYTIRSAGGLLSVDGWESFEQSGVAGPGWFEANPTAFHLSELNLTGSIHTPIGSSFSLGGAYDVFGMSLDAADLAFEYSSLEGEVFTGNVEFVGPPNNLLLTVDPITGEARLGNFSPLIRPDIDSYTIQSASGSLNPEGWISFQQSGAAGPGWLEANPNEFHLAELNILGSTQFVAGMAMAIGEIFDTGGARDLVLTYSTTDGVFAGVVEYAKLSTPLEGDTNHDGIVDIDDLNNVRNNFGGKGLGDTDGNGDVDIDDLNNVRNHFGDSNSANAQTVPEPAGLVWVVLAAGSMAAARWPH
jgi:hypothetical protein